VGLVALGTLFSFFDRALLYYSIIILVMLTCDFFLSHAHPFSIQRRVDQVLSIGICNAVHITINNTHHRPLPLKIRDEYPPAFDVTRSELQKTVPPHTTQDIPYEVIPYKRGEYAFQRIYTRRKSYLGLWIFEKSFDLHTPVKVYPNVQMVKKYDILSRKQLLNLLGIKPSRVPGRGTEFEMLRDYQIDDEYRVIDWKATSKKATPISRVYQVERTKNLLLMIDAGRIMGVYTGELTKLEHAVNSALLVSFVALRLGERVGLCIFSSRIQAYIPIQSRSSHFNVIVEALYNLHPHEYESNYCKAFEYVARKNRKRSLIIVYSDLIEKYISRELIQYCSLLQKVHLPLCVAVQDLNIMKIAESIPHTEQEHYRKAMALTLLRDRKMAIRALNQRGIRVVDELPQKLTISTLNRYLELKHAMRI
jgi:uncharacterized protein (DUF58 family)